MKNYRLIALALCLPIAACGGGEGTPDATSNFPIADASTATDSATAGDGGGSEDGGTAADAGAAADAPPSLDGGTASGVVINEVVADHIGADTNEFIEIYGAPNTDYSALRLLVIEGDTSGAGLVDRVLPVGTTNASGYWTTGLLNNQLENGTQTYLLVSGFSGAAMDDLDTDNNGTLDVMPWASIVDELASSDGGTGDFVYSTVALLPNSDGVAFSFGGASRIPNGTDTNTAADWKRNDYDGEGLLMGVMGTALTSEALNTPGTVNALGTATPADAGPTADAL